MPRRWSAPAAAGLSDLQEQPASGEGNTHPDPSGPGLGMPTHGDHQISGRVGAVRPAPPGCKGPDGRHVRYWSETAGSTAVGTDRSAVRGIGE